MRRGVIPNPNSEPLVGRGQLTSVWLGGLANPGALITSLKHEKAAMVGCTVDEVTLCCFFLDIVRIIQFNIFTMGLNRFEIITKTSSFTFITIEKLLEMCVEVLLMIHLPINLMARRGEEGCEVKYYIAD